MKDRSEMLTGIRGVTSLFSGEEELGNVTISKYKFSEEQDPLFNLRAIRDGGGLFKM